MLFKFNINDKVWLDCSNIGQEGHRFMHYTKEQYDFVKTHTGSLKPFTIIACQDHPTYTYKIDDELDLWIFESCLKEIK